MILDRVKFATALAKKDITINRLAELSGLSRMTISGVKHGKPCARETAEKLASVLGQELLEGVDMEGRKKNWIAELRGTRTQSEIAQRAGISKTIYGIIENEKRTPSVKIAKKLAPVLGCEWTKFYDE